MRGASRPRGSPARRVRILERDRFGLRLQRDQRRGGEAVGREVVPRRAAQPIPTVDSGI